MSLLLIKDDAPGKISWKDRVAYEGFGASTGAQRPAEKQNEPVESKGAESSQRCKGREWSVSRKRR
jgi:hypothetical protein